jgi:hypothetical protein
VLVIDSDIFLIDCRYQRDPKYPVNRRFLDELVGRQVERATTLFNLLEICGILSFNPNPAQLRGFYAGFARQYGLRILGPELPRRPGQRVVDLLAAQAMSTILRRISFGDALALLTAESHPQVTTFVTWNASHFHGKTQLVVATPEGWLLSSATQPA